MNKAEIITKARELIGQANVEEAIDLLLEFVKNDPKWKPLSRQILKAQSQYRQVKREEAKGVIGFENARLSYNRVNDQLFNVLEQLETGRIITPPNEKRAGNRWIVLVLIGIILLAGGIWGYNSFFGSSAICPAFDKSSIFNILILPFRQVTENAPKLESEIRSRLKRFSEDSNINADVRISGFDRTSANYPATASEAEEIVKDCNPRLVVWGSAERLPDDSTTIETQYKFFEGGETFGFDKIQMADDESVDKVFSLTSIATEGVITEDIENAMRLLFGVIAHETDNQNAAIEALSQVKTKDSSAILLKGMTIADSYLKSDSLNKAWESYNEVLETHPDYAFARNNRGMLNYLKGNYEEAAEDLTMFLEKKKQDTTALLVRGTAYLKAGQLDKAERDFSEVKRLKPGERIDKKVDEKLEEWRKEKSLREKALREATQKIRSNPNDLEEWKKRAMISLELGNYKDAIEAAQRIIRNSHADRDTRLKAFGTIIVSYHELGDKDKRREAIRKAGDSGFSSEEIKNNLPRLRDKVEIRESEE